jgi:hypothetical protein
VSAARATELLFEKTMRLYIRGQTLKVFVYIKRGKNGAARRSARDGGSYARHSFFIFLIRQKKEVNSLKNLDIHGFDESSSN